MKMRMVHMIAVALAGCGSEAVDDELTPVRSAIIPRMVSAQEAITTAHVPSMDPQAMTDAEIAKALSSGSFCAFKYARDGRPILAWRPPTEDGAGTAVVKLNGLLVQLLRQDRQDATQFTAGEIVMSLAPKASTVQRPSSNTVTEATLVFEIKNKLRVGYGGYTVCDS